MQFFSSIAMLFIYVCGLRHVFYYNEVRESFSGTHRQHPLNSCGEGIPWALMTDKCTLHVSAGHLQGSTAVRDGELNFTGMASPQCLVPGMVKSSLWQRPA